MHKDSLPPDVGVFSRSFEIQKFLWLLLIFLTNLSISRAFSAAYVSCSVFISSPPNSFETDYKAPCHDIYFFIYHLLLLIVIIIIIIIFY